MTDEHAQPELPHPDYPSVMRGTWSTRDAAHLLGIAGWRFREVAEIERLDSFGGYWEPHEVRRVAWKLAAIGSPSEKIAARRVLAFLRPAA